MAIEQNSIITANDITNILSKIGIKFSTTVLWDGNISGNSIATMVDDMSNYEFISVNIKYTADNYTPYFTPVIIHSKELANYSSSSNMLTIANAYTQVYFYFPSTSSIYSKNSSTVNFKVVGYKIVTSYTETITEDAFVPNTVTCLYAGRPEGTITLSDSYMNYNFLSISAYYTQTPCFIDSKLIPCAVINSIMTTTSNRIELTSEEHYFSIYFPTLTQMTLYSSNLGSTSNKFLYIYGVK